MYFVANRQSANNDEDQPDIVQDCLPTNEEDEDIRESKFNFLRKKSVMIRRKVSKSFSSEKEQESSENPVLLNVNTLPKNESVIFYD